MKLFSVFGEILLKDSASKGLDEAGAKAKGLSGIFNTSFGSILGAAAKLGAVLGVSLGFKDLFDKAVQGQKTMAQMDAVLKSTGGSAGMTKDALVDLANAQAKVTTFSAGTTKAAENLLLTFTGISKKTFPDTIKAAQDMSTAMGTDLNSTVMTLGKSLDDPVQGMTKLTKQGVTFTAAQKEQITAMEKAGNVAGAQSIILRELQKEFGGSAEASGKTFAGQLTILQNQLTSVGVGIVSKLLPPLTNFITTINNNMPKIQTKIGNVTNFIGNAITSLLPIIQNIISDVIKIAGDVFPKMGSSGSNLGNQILGLVKGGLTALKDVLDWFSQHGEATKAILIGIGTAFATWKTISTVATTINGVKSAITNVSTAINTAKSGFETFRIVAMYAGDGIKSAGSAMLSFGKSVGTALISLGKMTIELGANALAWVAEKAQLLATTIAEGATTVAQTALNLAMSLSPITIIIIAITALVAAIVILWNKNQAFRDFFIGLWNGIVSTFNSVVNNIKSFMNGLGQEMSNIGNDIKNVWNGIMSWFESLPSRFVQFGSGMINGLKNGISSVMGTIGGVISSGFNSAISFLTSLPSKALAWGRDFIDGLKNGIMSGISGIVSAVSGVADKIKSFLHFSVPDEGSLTDYESWMPDFMDGLASGIDKNKFKVTDSLKSMTNDMKLNSQINVAGTQVQGSANVNTANKNKPKQPIVLQIPLNGKIIAQQTYEDISELQENKTQQDGRNIGYDNAWSNV